MDPHLADQAENDVKFSKKEQGFTILELVVAIAILTFGLLAVASMQVSSIRGNAFAGRATEGATWATDRMEKLMDLAWDDPLIQDTDGDGSGGLGHATSATADQPPDTQGQYTIYWNVADDVIINDTKTVCVIVLWEDHGIQKSISMQRVIPRII
jgi:prepilin-type N-terminal cleavage/methylation domain-containing protein